MCVVFDKVLRASEKKQGMKAEDTNNLCNMAGDAVALVVHGSHEIDALRRKLFKPEINTDFCAICADNYPVDKLLFSEDLAEKIKETTGSNKITNIVSKNVKRFQPYTRGRPFLGRGGNPAWRRGRGGFPHFNQNWNNSSLNQSVRGQKGRGGVRRK